MIEPLLKKMFKEYNVDEENVFIMGHSFGGASTGKLAQEMSDYFSKAVICSGNWSAKTIPTIWYVGEWDGQLYKDAAYTAKLRYGENVYFQLAKTDHGTPIAAYNKDDGQNNIRYSE